jgi:hypothetical protein
MMKGARMRWMTASQRVAAYREALHRNGHDDYALQEALLYVTRGNPWTAAWGWRRLTREQRRVRPQPESGGQASIARLVF